MMYYDDLEYALEIHSATIVTGGYVILFQGGAIACLTWTDSSTEYVTRVLAGMGHAPDDDCVVWASATDLAGVPEFDSQDAADDVLFAMGRDLEGVYGEGRRLRALVRLGLVKAPSVDPWTPFRDSRRMPSRRA